MKVSLKNITPNAEINIVEIARVSSSRQDKTEKSEGLISYLIKNKHWSPFEHSFLTFEIETSMSIGEQLLRHRSFTFQKLSGRYTTIEAFEPIEIRRQAVKNRQSSEDVFDPQVRGKYDSGSMLASQKIAFAQAVCRDTYDALIEAGVAKEVARLILPACAQTKMYMTGSVRSWIHFLEIRDDSHAQKEAQLIAKEIKKIFKEKLPVISGALNY
jgi:thymidylate synthase (FAD)